MSDLLFDAVDDTEQIATPTNFLSVPGVADTPEQLSSIEAAYRKRGRPMIVFEDEDGRLENASEFAEAMGLKRLPTLEEAERFVLDGTVLVGA